MTNEFSRVFEMHRAMEHLHIERGFAAVADQPELVAAIDRCISAIEDLLKVDTAPHAPKEDVFAMLGMIHTPSPSIRK
jgi:hypothetical protein